MLQSVLQEIDETNIHIQNQLQANQEPRDDDEVNGVGLDHEQEAVQELERSH